MSRLSQHEFSCDFHTRCSKSTSAELDQLMISRRTMFCDSRASIHEILVDNVEQVIAMFKMMKSTSVDHLLVEHAKHSAIALRSIVTLTSNVL